MLAVFQDTPRAWAMRATVRWWTTRPTSAQRTAARESLVYGWTAWLMLWRRVGALLILVAVYAHVQDRGVPPVGYVSQAPDHRVAYDAFAPTLSTPPVLTHYLAGQDGPIASYTLARHLQSQAIQACERAQVRAIKGSIGHVEVFRVDGVGTPIIGRPRPLPGHDTPNPARHPHTLNYEEPV